MSCVDSETWAIRWLEKIERDTDVSEWAEAIRIILDSYQKLNIDLEAMRGAANSYKAENERLKYENDTLNDRLEKAEDLNDQLSDDVDRKLNYIYKLREKVNTAKSEARKELAENSVERVEKAKLKYQRLCKEQGEEMEEHISILFDGIIGIINNLLKEMEKEENVH